MCALQQDKHKLNLGTLRPSRFDKHWHIATINFISSLHTLAQIALSLHPSQSRRKNSIQRNESKQHKWAFKHNKYINYHFAFAFSTRRIGRLAKGKHAKKHFNHRWEEEARGGCLLWKQFEATSELTTSSGIRRTSCGWLRVVGKCVIGGCWNLMS